MTLCASAKHPLSWSPFIQSFHTIIWVKRETPTTLPMHSIIHIYIYFKGQVLKRYILIILSMICKTYSKTSLGRRYKSNGVIWHQCKYFQICNKFILADNEIKWILLFYSLHKSRHYLNKFIQDINVHLTHQNDIKYSIIFIENISCWKDILRGKSS
jgi:hypothetical protein